MSTVFHNILRAADKRYARRFAVLGAVFLAVLLGSLLVGRYALSPGQLVQMLWTRITGGAADWPISDDKVVFAVRLPRVAAAALVGAALAVSGAAYQGMFRNPMVSPDILGASTGASARQWPFCWGRDTSASPPLRSAADCWRWRRPGWSAACPKPTRRWP